MFMAILWASTKVCHISRKLFLGILKDMFDFKCVFLEVYAVLELNNCLTLYLDISSNYLVCIHL
jgi:hypothetical protein